MSVICKISVSKIVVPEGRREATHEDVMKLAESIETIGMLHPITVRRDGEQYALVAGMQRLEVMKQAGHTEIECTVLDCDELRCELAAIDENLIRRELHYIDIGELAIRRDEILDALGMRAKGGENQFTRRGGESGAPPQTTESMAAEMGIKERTLQEYKQLARDLIPESKEAAKKGLITKKDALELSRLKHEEQREVFVKGSGGKKAIAAALHEVLFKAEQAQRNALPASRTAGAFDKVEIGSCTLYQGDAFDIFPELECDSIDAVLTDPPYGITAEEWDKAPPLDSMWQWFDAITKATANFVMFAAGKFTMDLSVSNRKWYRYDLVWVKNNRLGFLNANKQPMRAHEHILVFGRPGFREEATYNPIKTPSGAKPGTERKVKMSESGIYRNKGCVRISDGTVHPCSILRFTSVPVNKRHHSTQKPIKLMKRLLKTYTNEGNTVFDPFAGSGTTALACLLLGRRCVAIEKEPKYFDIMCKRIEQAHRAMTRQCFVRKIEGSLCDAAVHH